MSTRRTHHPLAYIFAALGLLSSACGGGDRDATYATSGTEDPATEPMAAEQPPAHDPAQAHAQPQGQPPPAAAGEISREEVSAFSSVYAELMGLQQQAAAQVQSGAEPADVQAQMDQQVTLVFDQSPLTPERYEAIARQANEDDHLRQRIERELSAESAPSTGAGAP